MTTIAEYEDDLTGEMFRSQQMSLYQMVIPGAKDLNVAHKVVNDLLKTNVVMINDMNTPNNPIDPNRRYRAEETKAMECARLLKGLVNETNKFLDADEEGNRALQVFTGTGPEGATDVEAAGANSIDDIFENLVTLKGEISKNNGVISDMVRDMNTKREHRYVLDLCTKVLDAASTDGVSGGYDPSFAMSALDRGETDGINTGIPLMETGGSSQGEGMVSHICGVITADRQERFRATLFRVMRSNVVTTIIPLAEALPDPRTGEKVSKSVFITFLTSSSMMEKAKRICDAFACNVYECPRMSHSQLSEKINQLELREIDIERLLTVLKQTEELNIEYFWKIANNLESWSKIIHRERTIFHTLNKFRGDSDHGATGEFLRASCWVPTKKEMVVKNALEGGMSMAGGYSAGEKGMLSELNSDSEKKPTYFATNKYTGAFQGIVNAYGVAKYGEANPTLFALSIFPFLFGVMFGDLLHGSFLLIFSVLCIMYEDKLKHVDNEMFAIPFGGRYLLFIMSICAIYMGLIYNEVASVPLDLFGSAYDNRTYPGVLDSADNFNHSPYTVGMDPIWRWSVNNVGFTNSLKMKMAIILGVSHMTLGVVLKAMNKIYFKDMRSFFHESIPELVLFMSIFGYLCILIFVKWSTNWNGGTDCRVATVGNPVPTVDPDCLAETDRIQYPRGPPMLITTLINFAFGGSVTHNDVLIFASTCEDGVDGVCSGQTGLQMFLLLCAGISVPWLLCAKPYLIKKEMDAAAANHAGFAALGDETPPMDPESPTGEDAVGHSAGADAGDDHDDDFTEIFIHQVIHTIEYALGTVSNTASYLRLWALSLAHSQLSEVFWDMIFVGEKFSVGLNGGSVFMIVFCYPIWFFATIAVLMVMESLSAFLHALRLQWVEFQNKFYESDGKLFVPDSFEVQDTE